MRDKGFKLIYITLLVIGLLVTTWPVSRSVMAQVGTAVKNGFRVCSGTNCDNTLEIGGTISALAAATLTGFVSAPSNATYKVARGTVTLDGANPSTAATGLTTIVRCSVQNRRTTAPGLDPHSFTIGVTGASLDVYAWKPTTAADGTLIASTDADDTIDWICVGT